MVRPSDLDVLKQSADPIAAADAAAQYTGLYFIGVSEDLDAAITDAAAQVRRPLMQWILIAVGMSIFLVTAIATALIPFVWIGFWHPAGPGAEADGPPGRLSAFVR